MESRRPPSPPRGRAEQQLATREALVIAALDAFSRDGYHRASLDAIAREAGFSKGAVYSNFRGKAELFLAAMDHNLDAAVSAGWDPLGPRTAGDVAVHAAVDAVIAVTGEPAPTDAEFDAIVRGFSIATLEFISVAAREPELLRALRERVRRTVDAYLPLAAELRDDDDPLLVDDVARLVAALTQGMGLLALSGIIDPDDRLLQTGIRRLAAPSRPPAP